MLKNNDVSAQVLRKRKLRNFGVSGRMRGKGNKRKDALVRLGK
jgi:hypothetical protein